MKKFHVEMVEISTLVHPSYNPRHLTEVKKEQLDSELAEFGLVENVVVNKKNNHIVGGNQRVSRLREKGETHVPVFWVDLDLAAEKRLNLALNKLSGDWDEHKLGQMLSEMDSIENTGFTEDERQAILESLKDEDEKDSGLGGPGGSEPSEWVTFKFGGYDTEVPRAIYESFEAEIHRIKRHLYPDEKPDLVSVIQPLEFLIAQSSTTPLREG